MKKQYAKPSIIIESFQLNATIATSTCREDALKDGMDYIKLGYSEDTCTYDNGQFFNYDNCEFDLTGPQNDGNDTVCYHGPTFGIVFINS